MKPIAVHYIGQEEYESKQQSKDRSERDHLHGKVLLSTLHLSSFFLATHFLSGQTNGTLDDAPRTEDTDYTSHSDTTDTDALGIFLEDGFRGHFANGLCNGRIPSIEQLIAEKKVHARNDEQPYGQGTGTNDSGILQTDDITQTEDGRTGIDFQNDLGFIGQQFTPTTYTSGEVFIPPSEGSYNKIVQTTYQACNQQWLGLATSLFTGYQHLCTGGSFREWIFTVFVAYKILSERNQEEDTQNTTQQGADEHLHEIDSHFRIFILQDVKGRKSKDSTRYDYTRASTDRLDNDIFTQRTFTLSRTGYTYSNNGNWNSGFEHLTYLQTQISRGRREEDSHGNPPGYRP